MNRRSALIGLGGLVVGSGALVGTGAFTQVEAQRSVTVETTGDAAANLGIEPFDGSPNDKYVNAPDGGTIAIDIDDVNENAVTVIDRLLQVTYNGSQNVTVGFENNYETNSPDGLFSSLPGGWGYAVNDTETAVVVVWASPLLADMDNTFEEVRPDLVTTGFGGGSTLVNGNTIRGEVIDQADRTIGAGDRLHIGAVVDTRDSTIEEYSIPSQLDSTITFSAETTN